MHFLSCTFVLFISDFLEKVLVQNRWQDCGSFVLSRCTAVFPRATCTVVRILWKGTTPNHSSGTVQSLSFKDLRTSHSSSPPSAVAKRRHINVKASSTTSKGGVHSVYCTKNSFTTSVSPFRKKEQKKVPSTFRSLLVYCFHLILPQKCLAFFAQHQTDD